MDNENKYSERYDSHTILSNDVLSEEQEGVFFSKIRRGIKDVRKDLKMTQREFGETAGIDRRYVAKVECGSQNPSFKFLRSLSIKHKISLDWLLYGVGERFVIAGDDSYGDELSLFKKLLDTATNDDIEVVIRMIKKML